MNNDAENEDEWRQWQNGMTASVQGEAPEETSAVTKYGSQRLVNNGKQRRRGIVVVVVDDDGDEIAFYERFKDARPA